MKLLIFSSSFWDPYERMGYIPTFFICLKMGHCSNVDSHKDDLGGSEN